MSPVPAPEPVTPGGGVDLTDYLGKTEPSGLFGEHTMFNPAFAAWDDEGSSGKAVGWNTHHGGPERDEWWFATSDAFAPDKMFIRRAVNAASIASGLAGQATDNFRAEAATGEYTTVDIGAQIRPDGTGRLTGVSFYSDLNPTAGISLEMRDAFAHLLIKAMPDQTAGLIDLLNEDGDTVVKFTQDSLGSMLPLLGTVATEANPWSGEIGDAFWLPGYTPGYATAPSITFGTTGERAGSAGLMLQPAGAGGSNAVVLATAPWGSDATKTRAYLAVYGEAGYAQFQAGGEVGDGTVNDGMSFDLQGGGTSFFRVQKSIAGTAKFGIFTKAATPVVQSVAGTTAADAIACLKAFGFMAAA